MLKVNFLLSSLIFICLFSIYDTVQRNLNTNRPRRSALLDKYADNRINVNFIRNHPDYTVGNHKSSTKRNWVHKHVARSGSLFIRTDSGKVLYPGELNTVRNALSFDDFIEDFLIILPNAKVNTSYTLVAYSEGYLAKALKNLKGQDLYEGIKGETLGDVFAAVNKDELGNVVVKDTKYCIEILEQNPNEFISTQSQERIEWSDQKKIWGKELSGTAGKTCFVVLPKGMKELEKDFYNEFELLIETFENHLAQGKSSVRTRRSSDGSSEIVRSAVNEALERRASFIASPSRNFMYSYNPPRDQYSARRWNSGYK